MTYRRLPVVQHRERSDCLRCAHVFGLISLLPSDTWEACPYPPRAHDCTDYTPNRLTRIARFFGFAKPEMLTIIDGEIAPREVLPEPADLEAYFEALESGPRLRGGIGLD